MIGRLINYDIIYPIRQKRLKCIDTQQTLYIANSLDLNCEYAEENLYKENQTYKNNKNKEILE